MGLVEESADMVQVENDEMHVDTNFVNDREYEPNVSNPNQNTNPQLTLFRVMVDITFWLTFGFG